MLRTSIMQNGLGIALSIDAIVPAFDRQRLTALAAELAGRAGDASVWLKRNLEVLQRITVLGTGRGLTSSTTRLTFPYSAFPVWLTAIFSPEQSSDARPSVGVTSRPPAESTLPPLLTPLLASDGLPRDMKAGATVASGTPTLVPFAESDWKTAGSSSRTGVQLLAHALSNRGAVTIGWGISKLVQRYAVSFLRDLTTLFLVVASAAVLNLYGLVALAFVGACCAFPLRSSDACAS